MMNSEYTDTGGLKMENMDNNENEFQQNSVSNEDNGYTQAPNSNYTMNGQPMGNPYGQQPQQEQGGQALAIAGMVLGIISLVCCCTGYIALVIGIVGFVLSLISLIQKKPGKGMAIAGIICSAIAIVMLVVLMAIGSSISPEELQDMMNEIENSVQ